LARYKQKIASDEIEKQTDSKKATLCESQFLDPAAKVTLVVSRVLPAASTATTLLPSRDPNPPAMARFPTAPFPAGSGIGLAVSIAMP